MNAKEYLMNLPGAVKSGAIVGVSTVFHFDMEDEQVTVSVNDGKVDVTDGLNGEPKCVVKSSSENFMKLVNGELNPMMAIMMGKVKISNQGEMLKFAKILGIM